MADSTAEGFVSLIRISSAFVDERKGVWSHPQWEAFLSELSVKGYEKSGDMESHIGLLLDSMKKLYGALLAKAIGYTISEIGDRVSAFILQNREGWDHTEWERLIGEMHQVGFELREDTMLYIGSILESAKGLHQYILLREVKEVDTPPKKEPKKTVKKRVKKEVKEPKDTVKKVKKDSTPLESRQKKSKASEPKKEKNEKGLQKDKRQGKSKESDPKD